MKQVYTLEDLRSGHLPENARLAVLGYPISHSASPQMHQAALDALGIDVRYIRLKVEPGRLHEAFDLMRGLHFIGCNVTIPHKVEAMENCDRVSETARELGVANTIHFREAETYGDSTDGEGIVKALEEDFNIKLTGARVLVLGAGGGAGKATSAQLCKEGCKALYLSNRTVSKLDTMIANFSRSETEVRALGNGADVLSDVVNGVDLIINATSMGMKADDALPLPVDCLTSRHCVYDAIYKPPLTELLKQAHEKGASVANGLSMLVHQGAISFEIWTGKLPDTSLMKKAIL